jgi:predicted RNA-binding protein YlxR (DUF448 family)
MMKMKSTSHHIPERSCVACREVRPKRELIRLARTADNRVEIDHSGRSSGRGAYLCRREECWQAGLRSNRLEHALKTALTSQNREQLMRQGRELIGGADSGK